MPQAEIQTQRYKPKDDIQLLPLGGCDMVLGGDWLKKCRDDLINLEQLQVPLINITQNDDKAALLKFYEENHTL